MAVEIDHYADHLAQAHPENPRFQIGAFKLKSLAQELRGNGYLPETFKDGLSPNGNNTQERIQERIYDHSDFTFDRGNGTLVSKESSKEGIVYFTPMQTKLFGVLTNSPNQIVSHEELLSTLDYPDEPMNRKMLITHLVNIRNKIKQVKPDFRGIIPVYKQGYILVDSGADKLDLSDPQ